MAGLNRSAFFVYIVYYHYICTMTRKELIQNDGYWEAIVELNCLMSKGDKLQKQLTKMILKAKNELIETLKNEKQDFDTRQEQGSG